MYRAAMRSLGLVVAIVVVVVVVGAGGCADRPIPLPEATRDLGRAVDLPVDLAHGATGPDLAPSSCQPPNDGCIQPGAACLADFDCCSCECVMHGTVGTCR